MKNKTITTFSIVCTILSFVLHINAQDVISISEQTINGYRYDESILVDWMNKNHILHNDSIRNNIWNKLDSVAKSLNLDHDDEIGVYTDVAKIIKNDLIGLYKLNGDVIFEPKYEYLSNIYPSRLWFIKINDTYGLVNPTSVDTFLIQPKYHELKLNAIDSSDANYLNRFYVRYHELYGIIDSTGKEILPIEYSDLDASHNELYLVKKGDKYGFIKPSGEIVIPFMYDDCKHFWNNPLTPVKLGNKWGLINKENVLVVDTVYDDMFSFQKDILRVKRNGKIGFLNKQGDVFIDMQYDEADAYYKNEVLRVKRNSKFAILDKYGKELCEFKYDKIDKYKYPCTQAMINGKIGVLNNKGEEIVPVKYGNIDIEYNLIIVYIGAAKTYYNFEGEIIDN